MSEDKPNKGVADFNFITGSRPPKNININTDINKMRDLDEILIDIDTPNNEERLFRGYWLEKRVINVIDILTEGKKRGAKSELVNECLIEMFKKEGLIK